MKRLENLKTVLLAISFTLWLFTSITTPILILFKEPTTFDIILGVNSFIILFFFLTVFIPKAITNLKNEDSLSNLNLKTGSTKKKGECKSCKRKKRF